MRTDLTMSQVNFTNTESGFKHLSNADLQKAVFMYRLMGNTLFVKLGTNLTTLALKLKFPVKWLIKQTIFKQFCGGEDLNECLNVAEWLGQNGVQTILDYGLEGLQEEHEFNAAAEFFIGILTALKTYPTVPVITIKVTALARHELLEKVSAREILSTEEELEWVAVKARFFQICGASVDNETAVYIDAEESWIQDAIDYLVEDAMVEFNREHVWVYQTAQMYRHDRLEYVVQIIERAKASGWKVGLKLVRGAYMEKEAERASKLGYVSPIQPNKASSDRDFNLAMLYCLESIEDVSVCVATHNQESTALMVDELNKAEIPHDHPHVWFSQLYGMSDILTFNLAEGGFNATKYVPFGPVKKVMPYLIRRANENTSVKGQMGRELDLLLQEQKRRKHETVS